MDRCTISAPLESTASAAHWAAEREPASTLLGPIFPPSTTSDLLPDRGQLTSHDLSCTFYADETSAALWPNSRLLRVVSKADWALPVNGSQPGTWTVWRSRRCGFAASGHVPCFVCACRFTNLSISSLGTTRARNLFGSHHCAALERPLDEDNRSSSWAGEPQCR